MSSAAPALTVAQNLTEAYKRVQDPARRSLGAFARNEDGEIVSPLSEAAFKLCSIGTLIRQQHGIVVFDNTKSMRTKRKQASQLVNSTLQSEAYDALCASCVANKFQSVADMDERATEEQFHAVWTGAILFAEGEAS